MKEVQISLNCPGLTHQVLATRNKNQKAVIRSLLCGQAGHPPGSATAQSPAKKSFSWFPMFHLTPITTLGPRENTTPPTPSSVLSQAHLRVTTSPHRQKPLGQFNPYLPMKWALLITKSQGNCIITNKIIDKEVCLLSPLQTIHLVPESTHSTRVTGSTGQPGLW